MLLTVRMTNISDNDIDASSYVYDLTGLDMYFQYKVTDDGGHAIAKKIHKHPELAGGKPIMGRIIKPGETLTEEQDISHLLDVSKPGKYVIEVSRNLAKGQHDDGARSNKLIITVVCPAQPSSELPDCKNN